MQAEELANDRVLVVSSDGWNHGVIGIVASKLVEKYKKPVFIIGERGAEATGSARSFGDFSAADAVRAADDIIIKGGGHGAAAGVTTTFNNDIVSCANRVSRGKITKTSRRTRSLIATLANYKNRLLVFLNQL